MTLICILSVMAARLQAWLPPPPYPLSAIDIRPANATDFIGDTAAIV